METPSITAPGEKMETPPPPLEAKKKPIIIPRSIAMMFTPQSTPQYDNVGKYHATYVNNKNKYLTLKRLF